MFSCPFAKEIFDCFCRVEFIQSTSGRSKIQYNYIRNIQEHSIRNSHSSICISLKNPTKHQTHTFIN